MSRLTQEEIQLLAQGARTFVEECSPPGRIRTSRDDRDLLGWSRELWQEMVALGWPALGVPEAQGGLGLGFATQCILLEELGRNLVPEPLLTTAVATRALVMSGVSAAQDLLSEIAEGRAIVAIASEEDGRPHGGLGEGNTIAEGGKVRGQKTGVPDGFGATAYLVSARDDDGPLLCLVDGAASGVDVTRQWRVDGRNAATLELDGAVYVRLGGPDLVRAVFDHGAIGLAAEMLGGATRAFEVTLEYLKTREQFGVAIGTFQALQHRAARIFVELGMLRSALSGGTSAADQDRSDRSRMASLAKAMAGDTYNLVTREAIQLHGGIGMTDEHDIGLYLKRARVSDVTWGTAAWHRRRWATLGGY